MGVNKYRLTSRGEGLQYYRGFPIQTTEVGQSIADILDAQIDMLIYHLSTANKLLVLRVDIRPNTDKFDISRFNESVYKRVNRKFFSDTKTINKLGYMYVQEHTADKAHNHYHFVYFIQADRQTRAVKEDFIKESIVMAGRNYPEFEWYRSGYFLLNRNELDAEEQEKQRKALQDSIDNNTPHYNTILIHKIKARQHNNGVALGGTLHECIYSMSYLAKLASKVNLERYSNSFHSTTHNISRLLSRLNGQKLIDVSGYYKTQVSTFESYDSLQS